MDVLSVYGNIAAREDLPIINVEVRGKSCLMLLDTGSKLNLVSKSFLLESLGVSCSEIRDSSVCIKGVSGSVFSAAGEIDLQFSVLNRCFSSRFVVLDRKTFPADLLLSFVSLVDCGFVVNFASKSVVFPDGEHLSLSISNASQSLNVANLVTDCVTEYQGNECVCDIACSDEESEESTGLTHEVSLLTLNPDINFLNESRLVQSISGRDFHKYRIDDSASSCSDGNVLTALSTSRNNGTEVGVNDSCFSDISVDSEVCLVSVNEDASVKAKTVRDTTLVPTSFTKLELFCEDAHNHEVIVLNDKFLFPDVDIDNVIVRAVEGRFFVYARPNSGHSVSLVPGLTFCDVVVLENRSVMLSSEVLACTHNEIDSRNIEDELVKTDFPELKDDIIRVLNRFRTTVALPGDQLGRTNVIDHRIVLNEGATPFFVPNYRLPVGRREIVDNLVTDMKKQGVVTDSKSPYNSPLLLVPKKDGSWRLVIDFRRLNAVTVPDRMPMPVLDEVLANLGGATIFSSLDLLSGYWQVPLDESSKPLTAFSTHREHLQFEVMPFGLSNAPLTFVRLMQSVLGNMKNVYCYLDDIILFSTSLEDHFVLLEQVLDKLQRGGGYV